jgi:hypothetical protein
MRPQFDRYALVRLKGNDGFGLAVVLDYSYRRKNEEFEVTYTLHVPGGQEIEVVEEELEQVGQLEAPLATYAIVEIFPKEPRYASLIGQRGVVEGNAWNPKTDESSFAVILQNGEGWSFMHDELRDTGRMYPEEAVEARWGTGQVHIAVSPVTGEGIVLGEDSDVKPESFNRYVPLSVNLDDL